MTENNRRETMSVGMRKVKTSLREKRSNLIKTLFLIFVAVGIGGFVVKDWIATPSARNDTVEGKPVVKIGAILPLTGNMANTGQSIKKGIEFSIEDINFNLNNKFLYEVVFEDNQMQNKNTTPIANKLILYDKVSALMTLYSANAKITAPIIEKNKILGFHGTYIESGILDGVYNFENFSTLEKMESAIVDFVNSKNLKKVALVMQQTAAQQEMSKNLKNKLKGEIREFDNQQGLLDFKIFVYKLKEWQPDLVFISMDLPELDIFVREMQTQQVGGIKLGLDLMSRTENYPYFEGFYILNLANGDKKFVERFGREATYYAPYFYDNMMIFYNALESFPGDNIPSSEEISKKIRQMKSYDGMVGNYNILPNGQFETPLVLYKIDGGKAVVVEE